MDNGKIVSMLFNYQTTNRTDYRDEEITPDVPTVYKKSLYLKPPAAPPLKNTHSIAEWKGPKVPFSLMHKPKDIVRTNPYKVHEPFHRRHDEGHKEASIIMTPAVSMDDIKDNEIRELLIKDTYQSGTHRAMEEAVMLVRETRVSAPFPGLPTPANPVFLPRLRESVVSPQWRRETVAWDNRQLRSHIDANREFWMTFDLYKDCVSCKETAQASRMRKLSPGNIDP